AVADDRRLRHAGASESRDARRSGRAPRDAALVRVGARAVVRAACAAAGRGAAPTRRASLRVRNATTRRGIERVACSAPAYGAFMSDSTFDRFAERDPDAAALIAPDGVAWSRGRLAALVHRLARALRAAWLRDGDVLAVVAPNSAEFVAAYLAGIEAGLYV